MVKTNKYNSLECKKKFLRLFPNGFQDEKYFCFERTYKWETHSLWNELLNRSIFEGLLKKKSLTKFVNALQKLSLKQIFSFLLKKWQYAML